jgi:hypothetical protein
MLLVLSLAVLLGQAPAKPPKGAPLASETAKLFFLAGDIATAQEWAQRGLKREPKVCGPLNKNLAEYAFLVSQIDQPTPEQVRSFFELDRKISPTVRGKLTEKVYERFVTKPLQLARTQADGGAAQALQLLEQVLFVDPKNAEALELKNQLGR